MAVQRSLEQKHTTRVQFHFRRSELTSTMVQLRHTQLTVGSALRYGYTEARFLRAKLLLQTRESQTTEDARTEMVSVTSIRLKKREVTSNAASKES